MGLTQFFQYQKAALKSVFKSNTFRISGDKFYPQNLSASWINLEDKYKHYKTNPILNAVINKRANLCAKARFCVLDSKDNEVNNPVLELINKPNAFQDKESFIRQWVVMTSLDGGCFSYPIKPIGMNATALINVPMSNAQMPLYQNDNILKDYYSFTEKLQEAKVRVTYQGNQLEIKWSDLIPFYDIGSMPNQNDLINPISRIDSLKYDLSNIQRTLEAMNVMSSKPGGVGVIGLGSKSPTAPVAMTPEERKDLEDGMKQNYGLSHDKSIIQFASVPITYQSIMVKFADLGLEKINETSLKNILSAFDIPQSIFMDSNGAYGTKQEQGELHYIQDNISTTMESFTSSLGNYFELENKGLRLVAKFDHLPVFAQMRKDQAETLSMVNKTMVEAVSNELTTDKKAKEIINQLTGISYE